MMAFFAAAALSLLAVCPQVFAADEEAYFGSEEYFWEYGETSPIGVYAASSDTIESVVMTVSYDPDALEFIDGGTLTDVSGIIEVTADDIDDTVYKRLLYFTPITGGTTYITIESIEITDEDGNTATTEAVQMAIEVLVDGEIVINFSEDEAESETETESETEEETSEEETETETETVEETTQEEAGFFEEVLINHTTLSTIVALVVVVIIIDIVVTVRTERKRRRRRGKKQKKAAQKSAGGEDSVWGAMDKGASEESVKVDSAEPPAEIPAVQEKPTDNRKTIISVSHVTMEFKRDKDESTSLKELIIRMIKGQRQVITFRALDDISFTVKEGEVVGIIGTNGSGKSTILKIISGALSPSKGKVKVDRRKVQLLTLGTGFDRELTGRENVYLNGAIIGYSKQFIDEHFDSIVEFAELEGFMDEKVRNYSSGMVSRLGFAIATAGDTPEILMLDEVLSVGDMFFKQKSEARIQEMIHSGSTVIIVSHSMGVIKKNCTKVLWIEKSHLMMTGDPETVCKAYEQMNKKEK